MKIKFVVSRYRKGGSQNHFDSKLSNYWQSAFDSMFKNWREL